ncbi:uncharacterized protein LOC129592438 [Paramacrobiotus metropolitanus]|uniref:uncharacterized protein LOC129592438 n=1 Tax=Paramacrobiotus metropolitanus TaxID=2943436 RepID=UPI0024458CC7|nr:uncharacterized protein LOC129592438 [Paramacrobiotus metropolitanus]
MSAENHNLLTASSRRERIDRWFSSPWKSLILLRSRSKEISDADLHSPTPAPDTVLPRQIFGPNRDPVLVEDVEGGRYTLGYLCDIDVPSHRILVDRKCPHTPPEWIPADRVWAHCAVPRDTITPDTALLAAVRADSGAPYVFQPARVLFVGSLLYVQTLHDHLRRFVHPQQVRLLAPTDAGVPGIADPVRVMQSIKSARWRYKKRAVHLDPWQDAEKINMEKLLDALMGYKNTHGERSVVRIRVERERVHFFYREYTEHSLSESELRELVQVALRGGVHGSPEALRSRPPRVLHSRSNSGEDGAGLAALPAAMQRRVLAHVEDIHSVVSAMRVCRLWRDCLQEHWPSPHIAVDVSRATSVPSHSRKQEQKDGLHQLVTILDHAVTPHTVTFTLLGNLNPALEVAVQQCLRCKNIRLPLLVLKQCTWWRPLAPDPHRPALHFAGLQPLMAVSQRLAFRRVTVPGVFGPIADLWCSPAKVRTDVDVCLQRALLHCQTAEEERVRCFLAALNESCPDVAPADRDHVTAAVNNVLAPFSAHPLRNRLLIMLKLLNDTDTAPASAASAGAAGGQPSGLSKLAILAFKYSFPNEVTPRSQSPIRASPKPRLLGHDNEGDFSRLAPDPRAIQTRLPKFQIFM